MTRRVLNFLPHVEAWSSGTQNGHVEVADALAQHPLFTLSAREVADVPRGSSRQTASRRRQPDTAYILIEICNGPN